ncbi:MAG TPA: T9SS type A sorting domain-containing protein [Candidatus Kapabacteria bacterium]|nr:T9SS type A sorting domain-containing protein [Candidatus Kapabacteria bacterium]
MDTRSFSINPPTLTVKMCDSVVGMIYITNTTCGFLQVDSLSLPAGVTLPLTWNGNPQLPLDIPQSIKDSLVVDFTPGAEGGSIFSIGDTTMDVLAHMTLTEHSNTTSFDTVLALQIRVERGPASAMLSDTALNFGSVSTCDSATLPIVLMSTGCDTLTGIGFRVSGTGEFSIADSQAGSTAPRAPGSSDTILITYIPENPTNPSSDTLFITTNAGTKRVALSGTGSPGNREVSADTTARDFGALFECEERDTTIWLYNPGCDTLRVDSAVFSNASYSPDTAFPIFIAGNDSVAVRVHYTSTPSTTNGTVTFYSNANTPPDSETVPLLATAIPPATLRLVVAPSDSTTGGQIVTCYAILDGPIPAGMISALHFDITHNDDLLSFLNASGAGLTVVNTTPKSGVITQSFTLSPIPNSDTVGTLRFQVYLTDSTSTPLALSNISFASLRDLPPDCIASIADSGAQFTYVYRCGNQILQNYMLAGAMPFHIESVAPNPATSRVQISGKGLSVAKIKLFDLLGRQKPMNCEAISNGLEIDASQLPAGTYYLRASANGYIETRRFVVER